MHQAPVSRQITILSLDYDGCCDILFEQAIEEGSFKDYLDPTHKNYTPIYKIIIQETRTALEGYFMKETQHADRIELLVGSTRQTRQLDKGNNIENKNGLCFELYADLAAKKGWHFNKLLLADVENEYGSLRKPQLKHGTAMGTLTKNATGNYQYEEDRQADGLETSRDPYKKRIITHQLQAIAKQYPNDQIKFIFMDDRQDILDALKKHFMDKKKLHSNANIELKLVHFDIMNLCDKYTFKPANAILGTEEAEKQIQCHSHYNLRMQRYLTKSNAINPFSIFYLPVKRLDTIAPDYIYRVLKMGCGGLAILALSYLLSYAVNERSSPSKMTP